MRLRPRALSCVLISLVACREREPRLFELLSAERTGVTFANTITTSDSVNVQTDVYVYNGAGVAIGDIDNDGLADIFFSGNQVSSRLYLNKGQMRFEDITAKAGVRTSRWATGVSMVDLNHDGWLDIYVSVSGSGWSRPEERVNYLFINNRDRTFTEAAARYGIADSGFTTHAAFLDYDGDGCLDLFVLNNSPAEFSRADLTTRPVGMRSETPGGYNQLYRNTCKGTFSNVSDEAGILRIPGYGLGVAVGDLNRDGRPDIYVSNDGAPSDVLYVNNGNGTFTDRAARWLKHTSYAGMGVDIADLNDDGWLDILQADMLPHDPSVRKRMSGHLTYGTVEAARARGFRDDYSVNTLQLSNGLTPSGDIVFSEIAALAGVTSTDWSWSPLLADFDNDGHKDIFISNGYPKAVNDFDYQTAMFAVRRTRDTTDGRRLALKLLSEIPAYELPNHIFRNGGDLTFSEKTRAWGIDQPSISYGSAYGDLDNDGRLDLVVSNINARALIYKNVAPDDDAHHFLQVRLDGETSPRGIGAHITVTAEGRKQYLYQSPHKGFMSTMDDRAHFGLGRAHRVDSLEIVWPDARYQLLTGVAADRVVTVRQSEAVRTSRPRSLPRAADALFQPLDPAAALAYKHEVSARVDYGIQSLLPYMISRQGPPVAVADVNGDGLDDVFIGGSPGGRAAGRLYVQRKDGRFVASAESQPWVTDSIYEDWGALFFDANGDGRPDLYVASGGYHLAPTSRLLQDRLYVNTGRGFVRDTQALPPMPTSTATIAAGDFNGDGRPDLFVGGRLSPRNYPFPTRSYLLRNDGGRFTDVTDAVAPELVRPGGMITSAAWLDFDGDARLDLVTVGEWMPIRFFRNEGTRLRDVTSSTHLPPTGGWWYSLASGDFDGDGRPDLIAGNLGLNHTYTASPQSRFGVYAADFAGNQTTSIVLTQEIEGAEHPFHGLVPLGREIFTLGVKFPSYRSFAEASVQEAFTPEQLKQALHYRADSFASVFLHNDGKGTFSAVALPDLAQIAPIRAILTHDVDGDGRLDAIVAGNLYDMEPNTPRADAGNGLWLRGDGKGRFTGVPPQVSGFLAPLNVSGLALVRTAKGMALLVANTGDSLQTFAIRSADPDGGR